MTYVAALPHRGVIAVTGEDRVSFLQGLVSNDVALAAPGRAVWAGLLTPQGKWLADFFILSDGDRLLLDCEAAQLPMLLPRLSRFRLRARVGLAAAPDLLVHVAWGGPPPDAAPEAARPGSVSAPDPRLPDAGWRVLAPLGLPTNATAADWDAHRLALGLPEAADLEPEKTVLLEAGFDELNGVSWTKGCYMGQELTARTRYRGLLKRRLVPVAVDGPLPAPGTPVLRDGAEVGTMRSGRGTHGLALLRIGAMDGPLACGEARLTPVLPAWIRLPEPAG
ncbi:MAG: folate-binding protein YgfZ [Rhodospirillales bacterium 69-11]|nr:folate-binding protein YgfZ [Rhodospirillales bacterium]OJW28709.1 MAG: folate-binding protein YgfZ [Rhodospirillales bacterium 69-11]